MLLLFTCWLLLAEIIQSTEQSLWVRIVSRLDISVCHYYRIKTLFSSGMLLTFSCPRYIIGLNHIIFVDFRIFCCLTSQTMWLIWILDVAYADARKSLLLKIELSIFHRENFFRISCIIHLVQIMMISNEL